MECICATSAGNRAVIAFNIWNGGRPMHQCYNIHSKSKLAISKYGAYCNSNFEHEMV